MTNLTEIQDTLNIQESDNAKLPQMLNVLTILTYIGCAFAALGAIYNYFTVCKSAEVIKSMDMSEMGNGALGKMMGGAVDMVQKQCDNKVIILLATLLCTALCFYGAMQMRNYKKQGFMIYTIGELLLPIITIVLLGSGSIMGAVMITGLIIPIVFVVLYASQRKHLIN